MASEIVTNIQRMKRKVQSICKARGIIMDNMTALDIVDYIMDMKEEYGKEIKAQLRKGMK